MLDPDTLSLVIAPRRQIVRDVRANSGPILIAIVVLLAYIIVSSAVISYLETWSYLHAGYFTVINVTTVGFGDVVAVTPAGKLLSGVNAFFGLLLFGVLVALITLAFQPSEFTGTAKPASVTSPPTDAEPRSPNASIERAASDLLRSVRRLVDTRQEAREGTVRIALDDHGESGAHVFIDILVRRVGNA